MSKIAKLAGACVLGLALLFTTLILTGTEATERAQAPQDPEFNPLLQFDSSHAFEGKASWYGPGFHGKTTSTGEIFDRYALTAAHRDLRPGSVVRVTNLQNDQSALLVINDWGPVPADRVIDVSEAAADILGFHTQGVARVRVEVLRATLN